MVKTISVRFTVKQFEEFKIIQDKYGWTENNTMKYILEEYLNHRENCSKINKIMIKELTDLIDEKLSQIK